MEGLPDQPASLLAQATAILSQLSPSDLAGEDSDLEVAALIAEGRRLFTRPVLHAKYGEKDVVEFLREQAGHRELLRRLEKLQKQIAKEHAKRVDSSRSAGINVARKATLDAIEASACDTADGLELDPRALKKLQQANEEGVGAETGADATTALVGPGEAAALAPIKTPRLPPRAGAIEAAIAVTATDGSELSQVARLAAGSFRRACGVCKQPYHEVHTFYHRLCPECAPFNYAKRMQTADLRGFVAVVTGGRVRIGYEIVLKLLRAGCHVICTTRFPADAAARYAAESDFDEWRQLLELVGPLELANVRHVEAFCAQVCRRYRRVHFLINNAAQTLTREAGWFVRMDALEATARETLPTKARGLLASSASYLGLESVPGTGSRPAVTMAVSGIEDPGGGGGGGGSGGGSGGGGTSHALTAAELAAFPAGKLDETRQPLDLSRDNSWSRRLGEVPTTELLHTLAANAVAPFVMCGALRRVLSPVFAAEMDGDDGGGDGGEAARQQEGQGSADGAFGHIINVSALEGKFYVGKKGSGHPHTNMSKAALNMLTHTSAAGLYQDKILVNAVDTGWVTDMAPGGVGAVAATHATHVGPPLDAVDGAARVLDPIFSHLAEPSKWLVRGKFWKDYVVSSW
jgi:NAD(P)-dependent dehydrogenase (short-subunit alcohol dehydrogenase family)